MSGQGKYRDAWSYYYAEVDGIFYVIDSTDSERRSIDIENLSNTINHPDLAKRRIPFLIIFNKQDKEGAYTIAQLEKSHGIDKLKGKTRMKIGIRGTKAREGKEFGDCLSFFIDNQS